MTRIMQLKCVVRKGNSGRGNGGDTSGCENTDNGKTEEMVVDAAGMIQILMVAIHLMTKISTQPKCAVPVTEETPKEEQGMRNAHFRQGNLTVSTNCSQRQTTVVAPRTTLNITGRIEIPIIDGGDLTRFFGLKLMEPTFA